MSYRVAERLADGLFGVESARFGRQLWAVGRTFKAHRCASCQGEIPKASQAARPIGHLKNRMDRLCPACLRGEDPG